MTPHDDLHGRERDAARTDARTCGCISDDDQYRLRLMLEDALARRCSALALEDRGAVRAHTIAAQKLRWRLTEAMGRAATYAHHDDCPHRIEPTGRVADL